MNVARKEQVATLFEKMDADRQNTAAALAPPDDIYG